MRARTLQQGRFAVHAVHVLSRAAGDALAPLLPGEGALQRAVRVVRRLLGRIVRVRSGLHARDVRAIARPRLVRAVMLAGVAELDPEVEDRAGDLSPGV